MMACRILAQVRDVRLCLPGADGANDTEGSVAGGEDLLLVLNALLGNVEGSEVLEEQGDHVDLHGGELALQVVSTCVLLSITSHTVTHGLAGLLAEEVGHLLGVLGPLVAELLEKLLALLNGDESVGLEGLGGALDSIVDVLLVGNGHSPELLASGRVDTVVLVLGIAGLAGDDVGEGVPLDRHGGGIRRCV